MELSSKPGAAHWDSAYADGDEGRSWYQLHAATSLELVQHSGSPADAVIDVGAGASTLVDDLLSAGYRDVTLLDISKGGMEIARERLGTQAQTAQWLVADLLQWQPQRTFDVWHDRAVLHFLTGADEQSSYRRALLSATHTGSRVVVGVFGPNGPQQCSGLDVGRFGQDEMAVFLGDQFTVSSSSVRVHMTPSGGSQEFLWTTATRTG